MPGGTFSGLRARPYSLYFWLDSKGRIRLSACRTGDDDDRSPRPGYDHACLVGEHHELRSVPGVELPEQPAYVGLDRER
jgi:hypothetical protein